MGQPIPRAPKIGAYFGFVLAVLIFLYEYLRPHFQLPAINDWLIVIACPPSISFIALDNADWHAFVVADAIVMVANVALYAGVFGFASLLFRRGTTRPNSTQRARD